MRVSDAFPSNYLKPSDLQGRAVTVKMDRADFKKLGNDQKLVLYFIGKEKGMVLNKTNANNISYLYGDDTDLWHGNEITLFEAMVDFQGKTVPAIRVRGPQRAAANRTSNQAPPPRQPEMAGANSDMDDQIPF